MERCDFASICAIIRRYLLEGAFDSQVDFAGTLFDSYVQMTQAEFDNGLLNKWLNGINRLSPGIRKFYQEKQNCEALAVTLQDAILPSLTDSGIVVQEVYDLLIHDTTVSARKKETLTARYPCASDEDEASFLADTLVFGIVRDFIARDIRKPLLSPSGNLSPVICDYVFDEGLPKPCPNFCGRGRELEGLHKLLMEKGKVFLRGIPGIGKSELAKAYARFHKKDYTNILFITYSGDLKRDIANLSFTDDYLFEGNEELFHKHNRFLRTLKPDTLIIVDNFNVDSAKDEFLPVLLKYRCRVLITTRNNLPGKTSFLLEEISDKETLFQLASYFDSASEEHRSVLEAIIEIIYSHTFAVELVARLLESGILQPQEVLQKLEAERASFDASDKIRTSKDGKAIKATYYEHIHTLFGLFGLSAEAQYIMRNLTLTPSNGIQIRLFSEWMKLQNLNAINGLIELGLLTSMPGRKILLHPMIRDVAVSEFSPSLDGCRTMLESIVHICERQGQAVSYYKVLFQVIENMIAYAENNDEEFYCWIIKGVFPYMKQYDYTSGIILLAGEMERLIKEQTLSSPHDHALLYVYQAYSTKNANKKMKLLNQALSELTEIDAKNASLASSLYCNLGIKYWDRNQFLLGKQYLEEGISILNRFHLVDDYDSIVQFINYAIVLTQLGKTHNALSALCTLEETKSIASSITPEHAMLLKVISFLSLCADNQDRAMKSIVKAMSIYTKLYIDEPDMLAEIEDEVAVVSQAIRETGGLPLNWMPTI